MSSPYETPTMETLVVKVQCDLTGQKVLLTQVPCGTFLGEFSGMDAAHITRSYGLGPLGKTFCDAEVDANGLLHLGEEIEEPRAGSLGDMSAG